MRAFKILMCVVLISATLSGCKGGQTATHGLGEMTIVQGIGIDLDKEKTAISIQYLDLGKGGRAADSLNGNITTTASGTADSIADALSSTSKTLSQEIFLGQNKLIIFGSKYAANGIEKGLDFMLRSVASRPDVAVAMSSSKAEDIIKNKGNDVRVPAENVFNLLRLGEKSGLGAIVTVNDLLNLYSDKTSDIYLPVLKIKDEIVSCEGIAVFSKTEYQKTLSGDACFGFLFVKNEIEGGTIVVKDTELGAVGVEILSSNTHIWLTKEKGKPVLNCKINTKLMLDEIEKGITASVNDKKISEIEKLVNEKIEYMCVSAINECFDNESDPFMLGRYAQRDYSEYYENYENEWRENLKNISPRVNAYSKLVRVNDNSVRS